MNESDQELNQAFLSQGGIYDLSQAEGGTYFKQLIQSFNNHLNRFKDPMLNLPDVHIGFINNSTLNAVAGRYKSKYFIGINVGTIMILDDLFNRMLSNPNILIDYGDALSETNMEKVFTVQMTDYENLFNINGEAALPKDKVRQNLARHFTAQALKFLVTHEYGHIVCGHLGYLDSLGLDQSLKEADGFIDNKINFTPIFSQTLELDADSIGIVYTIRSAQYLLSIALPDEFKLFYKNLNDTLSLWLFPIYSLWKLSDNNEPNSKEFHNLSHPSPSTRQYITIATISTMLISSPKDFKLDGEEIKRLVAALHQTTLDVENAFSEISEQIFDDSLLMLNSEVIDHSILLQKNWNNVRPLLEPFAFVKLAPLDGAI